MENYLLMRKTRYLSNQIQQEFLQILVVCQEQSEELIGLLESNDSQRLQVLGIVVQLLEDIPLVRSQHIISFFSSDDLTDRVSSYQQLNQLDCLLAFKFHEILTKLDDIFFFFFQGNLYSDVFQSMFVVFFILNQYLEIQFVFIFLFSQSHSLFIVVKILTNLDRSFNIEKVTFKSAFRKEMAQILYLLFFHIAVEQQSCMLLFRKLFLVNFLKILNQVVNL